MIPPSLDFRLGHAMSRVKTIMIVDDDADDREIFIEALKEVDPSIKCLICFDGEDALQYIKSRNAVIPDMIFLDLNMPRLNGMQCLAEIRKMKKLDHIPIVIYSTNNNDTQKSRAIREGAAYYITKPVYFHDICKAIRLAMEEVAEKNIQLL